MQNKLFKNKKYLIFMFFLITIGIISGIFYYAFQSNDIKSNIINTISSYNSFRYNAIFKDLIIMSLLLVSSFFIIGLPLGLCFIFYEGLSIGFLISIFLASFKLKGLIYILIYLIINKIITLILMLIFLKKIFNISRYTIGLIIYKNENLLKEKVIKNFINSLSYIIIVFILNIFLYFLSIPIFSKIAFLLH